MLAFKKFESVNKCSHVEGCVDPDIVANKFAMNFRRLFPVMTLTKLMSSVTENLVRRIDSRVEWSTESKAELRSSKASAAT